MLIWFQTLSIKMVTNTAPTSHSCGTVPRNADELLSDRQPKMRVRAAKKIIQKARLYTVLLARSLVINSVLVIRLPLRSILRRTIADLLTPAAIAVYRGIFFEEQGNPLRLDRRDKPGDASGISKAKQQDRGYLPTAGL
jgi:hypothetical protein